MAGVIPFFGAVRAALRWIACSPMTAEVDRAGVASRQNPAVVDLDAQNVVQAPDDRGGHLGEKIYHADSMVPWVNRLIDDTAAFPDKW
jgi:hypothetical protein